MKLLLYGEEVLNKNDLPDTEDVCGPAVLFGTNPDYKTCFTGKDLFENIG